MRKISKILLLMAIMSVVICAFSVRVNAATSGEFIGYELLEEDDSATETKNEEEKKDDKATEEKKDEKATEEKKEEKTETTNTANKTTEEVPQAGSFVGIASGIVMVTVVAMAGLGYKKLNKYNF